MCLCSESEFTARASSTGGARTLRVEGTCTCPQSGFKLRLEPADPHAVPQPVEVALRLVVQAPQIGLDVITQTPISYEAEIGDEAERVVVRLPGDQPALTLTIAERDGGD